MSLKIIERVNTLRSVLMRVMALQQEMDALQNTEDDMYANWEAPGETNHSISFRYQSALQEMNACADLMVNMIGETTDPWTYVPADDRDLNDAITSITIDAVDAANRDWATITFVIPVSGGFSLISGTFRVGDEITLSGFTTGANNDDYRILDIDETAEEVHLASAGDTDESAETDAEIDLKSRPIYVWQASATSTLDIDADNGSSKAELTLNSGLWSTQFEAGSSIALIGAEESANDGTYVVDSVSADMTTLTLTTAATTDNASDEAIIVCLL